MKNVLKIFFIFLFLFIFSLSGTDTKAYGVTFLQSTPSMNYLQHEKSLITLDLNEDSTYYVIQNPTNSEITNTKKENDNSKVFGEDALTEENVLRHFIFKENYAPQEHIRRKFPHNLRGTIYTRAP